MIIDNIKAGKRGNILVYADGQYLLSLPREVFLKTKLKVGYDLSEEEAGKISSEVNAYKASAKALNLLSYRAHSKKELESKLCRTLGEDAAKDAAEKMERVGLVNDEQYAESYAYHLSSSKLYAAKRIAFELSRKGISQEIISNVLGEAEAQEEENIRKIISKRPANNEKEKRRLTAYLMRLGYDWSQISQYLKSED